MQEILTFFKAYLINMTVNHRISDYIEIKKSAINYRKEIN